MCSNFISPFLGGGALMYQSQGALDNLENCLGLLCGSYPKPYTLNPYPLILCLMDIISRVGRTGIESIMLVLLGVNVSSLWILSTLYVIWQGNKLVSHVSIEKRTRLFRRHFAIDDAFFPIEVLNLEFMPLFLVEYLVTVLNDGPNNNAAEKMPNSSPCFVFLPDVVTEHTILTIRFMDM